MENSDQKPGEDSSSKGSQASPELNKQDTLTNDVQGDASDKKQDAVISEVLQDCKNLDNNKMTEIDEAEMKVKIICLEKNNLALKMELRCAELQFQAKEKVDVQKTRLLELMDKKVSSQDKRNTHLMDMLEGLIKEKEGHARRLLEATKHMEDLSTKLAESERMRNELRKMNQELKTMLGDIENKGSQLAKLAKDKILKYKDDAVKMQQQLDDLKDKGTTQDDEQTSSSQEMPLEAAAADGERFQHHWKKIEELHKILEDAFQDKSTGCLAEKVTTTNKEIKEELNQLQLKFNTTLDGSQEENEKLRSELGSIRQLVMELHQLSQDSVDNPTISSPDGINDTAGEKQETSRSSQEKINQIKPIIEKLVGLITIGSPSLK